MLGYNTRIQDQRRGLFWLRKAFSYGEVLGHSCALADALSYCQARAVVGGVVLHRDLKSDYVGFTLDVALELLNVSIDRVVKNTSPYSEEQYLSNEWSDGVAKVYGPGSGVQSTLQPLSGRVQFWSHFVGIAQQKEALQGHESKSVL
jgi:hypothetical protein